jgi:hypothetical protein
VYFILKQFTSCVTGVFNYYASHSEDVWEVEVYIREFGTYICGADKELRPNRFNPREKPEATA